MKNWTIKQESWELRYLTGQTQIAFCVVFVITTKSFDTVNQLLLTRDGSEFREVRDKETPTATLTYGPSPIGGIVFFQSLIKEDQRNQPTAPEIVRAIRFADATIGTDFGPLECATPTHH